MDISHTENHLTVSCECNCHLQFTIHCITEGVPRSSSSSFEFLGSDKGFINDQATTWDSSMQVDFKLQLNSSNDSPYTTIDPMR